MKIKVFEIKSKKNRIYKELMEQYKVNSEIKELLHEKIGRVRLISALPLSISLKDIKVYLIKDIDSNKYLWVVGKLEHNEEIIIFPLLKDISEEIRLEVRRILSKMGFLWKIND